MGGGGVDFDFGKSAMAAASKCAHTHTRRVTTHLSAGDLLTLPNSKFAEDCAFYVIGGDLPPTMDLFTISCFVFRSGGVFETGTIG